MRADDVGAPRDRGTELTLARAAARMRDLRRRRQPRPPRRHGALYKLWPVFVAAILLALTLVFVAEPVRVSSDSMSPTFHSGDHVLVQKIGARAQHPHRRDIIAFHLPGSSELLIKRVVAIAGDSVGIADGVLVVNRHPLREAFVDYNLMDATYFGPVRVPANAVFTMGDNRSNSFDSRRFGPVRTNDIVGRVFARVWPP